MGNNYVVYHLHSDLSSLTTTLDSVTKYKEYIDYAKELGMKALGFSEHGVPFEWWHKKTAIEAAGMKFIHAVEAYVTEDLNEKRRDNYHCVLIAKNYDGVLELNRLISGARNRDDGHFYYMPRITMDELFRTSENILITTACIGGLLWKTYGKLRQKVIDFCATNRDRCFFEVQHHNDGKQIEANKLAYKLSQQYDVPLIAGTDTHALNEKHVKGREILQRSKNIHFDDEDNWDLTFKTYDELVVAYEKQNALPRDVFIRAIENTNMMADMIEPFIVDCGTKYPHIYDYPVETFKKKINQAYKNHPYVKKRYTKDVVQARVREEMAVYEKTNSIDFMLLETYMREWERSQGIHSGPGRGSVSGSFIAYLLGITEMDSIKFNLNFFRFMNPDRVSNADIDTDYASRDRDKVKEFLLKDHMNLPQIQTCEIVTFNTIAMKGAIKDVARALGMKDLQEVQQICDAVKVNEKKQQYIDQEWRDRYPELFEYVDIVNGTIVSMGTHPSGVLVSDRDIASEIGLCSTSKSKYPVSILNMKELDDQMWVKLDILGLDNLGLINETCKLLHIPPLTPDSIDLEDEAVWKDIRDDTTMIFQWESDSAQSYLERFMSDETIAIAKEHNSEFTRLKWLSFGNGLIRPACASFRDSVANGEFYDNGFKELNELLSMEAGRVAMQETVMKFLVDFCGYTNSESDNARRCVCAGTKILMGDGSRKRIEDIIPGEFVQSLDDMVVTSHVVEAVYNNGKNAVLKIKTSHGYSLKCTADHKVLTQRGWVEAKELNLNDFLMTPSEIVSITDGWNPGKRMSCKQTLLLGLLIGDGTLGDIKDIVFTNSDIDIVNAYKECVSAQNLYGPCEFKIYEQNGVEVDKIYAVRIASSNYKESIQRLILKYNLNKYAADKSVPSEIMLYPIGAKLASFLAGLFSTDGGYNAKANCIEYYSISKELVYDIKSLLLKYGIYSYVMKGKVAKYEYDSYRVRLQAPDSIKIFLREIVPFMVGHKKQEFINIISNRLNNNLCYNYLLPNECKTEILNNSKKMDVSIRSVGYSRKRGSCDSDFALHWSEFGVSDVKAAMMIDKIYAPLTYKLLHAKYIPVRIQSIEDAGTENVYDLQIDTTHNYIANNLIVHNCIAKKKGTEELLPEIETRFIKYSPEHYNITTKQCAEIIKPFLQIIQDASSYAFSWNHSDPYSYIGYAAGYLRYYHPKEFLTAALNIFADNEEKTKAIISYANKIGITVSGIKFGHSGTDYSAGEGNIIYKGMASIKYLNRKIAKELQFVANKNNQDFCDVLYGIKRTSVDARQLEILIKLGFFSEYGNENYLLKYVEIFNDFFDKKQISKALADKYDVDCDELNKLCEKVTEKTYSKFDPASVVRLVVKSIKVSDVTMADRFLWESEHMGYIQTVVPDISPQYAFVQEIESKYKNPTLTLYRLCDGTTEKIKVKRVAFDQKQIAVGNIIKTIEKADEGRWFKKDADWQPPEEERSEWFQGSGGSDFWQHKTETEPILKKWSICK